ncbi:Uncharacterised protein [uncultured archaeon]|nr:Uncharacterised protein [uncultured archaeon]
MFDIIRARNVAPESFNFSKFYFLDDVKNQVVKAPNLEEAMKQKNRKVLILLDEYREDIGLMKQFAEKSKAAFLIDLGRIIETNGFKRAVEMAKMRRFLRVCVKYEVPFALATFAKDEFSIRTAHEVCHIAGLVGLNAGQAKFGLERLEEYLR